MLSGSIEHYRILRPLGQGGMGEVYLAEDTKLARRVAIKTLPAALQRDAVARQRLLREARAAAALNQPNICTIHEVGEHDGLAFVVMEFVEGETLRDVLARGRLDQDEALRVMTDVADALEEAHRLGVVHRDLKPANIMRTRKGHAKVMDFGLARQVAPHGEVSGENATETALTAAGTTVGTLAYMAPEQLKGGRGDVRSDLFAFGVVLYELLTGQHPFARPSAMETAAAILNSPAPRVGEALSGCPAILDHVVGKLLAKAPDDRYQSVHDVRTDLDAVARGDDGAQATIVGLPVTMARRSRWVTAAVLGTAVILGAAWAISRVVWPPPALAFGERDWIVLADFDNQTGEPVLDRSLDMAMAVSLQQSKYVNVFPRTRVQQTLVLMRKADAHRLDERLAREVAAREGLRAAVVPRVARVGDEYLLTAEIVDPNTHATVASSSVRAPGQNAVLAALDDLSRQTRAKFGESLSAISQGVALPAATTTSLEALKAFAESRRPNASAAETLLLRAVELDPDFAMARADLGLFYYTRDNRPLGEAHFTKALSLVDRLTLRERLWIHAVVDDWRGNRESGIERYKTYVSQYPDDAGAWFRLGYAYMLTNQAALAIEPFTKALALNPADVSSLVNIATCYNGLRRNDEAYAAYQRAFAINPQLEKGIYVNGEYGFLLARMGRLDDAQKTFDLMRADEADDKKARGLRSLGQLDVYRGRYADATRSLTESARINRTAKYQLSELRDRMMLEAVLRTRGQRAAAAAELQAILRLLGEFKPGVNYLGIAGAACARHNRFEDAERLLTVASGRLGDLLASTGINQGYRDDQAAIEQLKGEIQLARRQWDQAIAFFEETERLIPNRAVHLLAEAELERGGFEKAAAHYRRIIALDNIGGELTGPTVIAHYQLARVLELQNDRAGAHAEYATFLTMWKDGDADLPVIVDAKQRLAKLNRK